MPKLLIKFLLATLIVIPIYSRALAQPNSTNSTEGLKLVLREEPIKTTFSMGAEVVGLKTSLSTITGAGSRMGFEHSFNDKFGISANISFTFQATKKPGAYLYSGFNGLVRYSVMGSGVKTQRKILSDETVVYHQRQMTKNNWWAGAGMEQLFLNGADQVYPAVGPMVSTGYTFRAWDYEFGVDLKVSQLIANDKPLLAVGSGININIDL